MIKPAHNLRRKLLQTTVFAAATGMALSVPAFAQNTDEDTAAGDDPIVVTGRLRGGSESVQDVPLAVTVISPAQLGAQGAVDIQDLETLAPSVVIDPVAAGPGAGAISIRGVSFEDVEKSFEPTVGVVIDGVFSGTNTAQLTNAFDFAQVEVLRGPQGTLFGRNTIGGVINVRRSKPTKEFGLRAEATIGNFGRQEFNGVFNIGDGEVFGLKLFGSTRDFDGYYRNETLDRRVGSNKNTNVGGTILLEPADGFEILLTAEHTSLGGEPIVSPLSNNTDLICAFGFSPPNECGRNNGDDLYTTFGGLAGSIDFNEISYSAELNYDIGQLTLTSISALKDSDEGVVQDFEGSSANFFQTSRSQDYRQFSQELRLAGEYFDGVSGVIGLFYFENEYQLAQTTNFALVPVPINQGTDHEVKSYAVFADFDISLTDQLRLSLGARYSYDEKEYTRTIVDGNTGVPGTFANEDDWGQFTPRVSLDYRFNDDFLAYASYSRGYRAGGFNGRAGSQAAVEVGYDPETVDSFEIGAKSEFMDGRVTLNVAGFYSKYNDKQEEVVQPATSATGQETVTLNAANATIFGAELDLRAELFDGFTITGALGLLDASYDDFFIDRNLDGVQDANEDASGRSLRRTPDVTFSVAANYELPVGNDGELNFNARYATTSSYQTTINADPGDFTTNDPRGLHPSLDNLSASITYTHAMGPDSEVYIRAFGRNLTNDKGLGSALPVAVLFTFGSAVPPRQYGGTVGFRF